MDYTYSIFIDAVGCRYIILPAGGGNSASLLRWFCVDSSQEVSNYCVFSSGTVTCVYSLKNSKYTINRTKMEEYHNANEVRLRGLPMFIHKFTGLVVTRVCYTQ